VIKAKTDIGENGFFAIILDSEGNRIALHSIN
jgi:predicted enzyme related to lactoylglutathione lyase